MLEMHNELFNFIHHIRKLQGRASLTVRMQTKVGVLKAVQLASEDVEKSSVKGQQHDQRQKQPSKLPSRFIITS